MPSKAFESYRAGNIPGGEVLGTSDSQSLKEETEEKLRDIAEEMHEAFDELTGLARLVIELTVEWESTIYRMKDLETRLADLHRKHARLGLQLGG